MADKYIVISYSSDMPKYTDCQVVEEDALYQATHSQVFGPASKSECEKWLSEKCTPREEGKG